MFDLIIKNGKVIDGTGEKGFNADIGIKNDEIVEVGNIEGKSQVTVDATGEIVCPGFIDVHGHSDIISWAKNNYDQKIKQGVTTEVIGSCGLSVAPCSDENLNKLNEYVETIKCGVSLDWDWRTFKEFISKVSSANLPLNIIPLVGHGTIRIAVMGFENRDPTNEELESMKKLTVEAMEAGAFGISSGLVYPPGAYAKSDELIELCKVVSEYGGIYSTHMRNESNNLLQSIEEAILISDKSGADLLISHLKAMGKKNWGIVNDAIELIKNNKNINIYADQYPYSANSTFLNALVPPNEMKDGLPVLLENLKDANERKRIINEIENTTSENWENLVYNAGGWSGVMVMTSKSHPELEGKTIQEIAISNNKLPGDVYANLMIENEGEGLVVTFTMSESDVEKVMQAPFQVFGSDGLPGKDGTGTHPRIYGTFPRVISEYVNNKSILSLEQAINKMTKKPAEIFNIKDRGVLKRNKKADIVIFDVNKIKDTATYKNPNSYPEGISYVINNGKFVVKNNEVINNNLGSVLLNK